ncbi:uncharacterized protein LOC102802975 [Saccoglossus kowalevskii]|uniref:ATP-dependent DNA helicase n=1 Tax=Saccoglossus kowalevskii TaxID=10224 RepID=A0ABM0MDP5_SACKO|nr:PREDICTED: ATP-dependent DNA helicase PIF1-like [Saccoglossus kowalevskii]
MATVEENIMTTVNEGHNLLILGQVGTGKTKLITGINGKLMLFKKVVMTALTGMAATLLRNVTTIHWFLRLMDGRFQSDELIQRIENLDDMAVTKIHIKEIDVLIINEVPGLSKKMFIQGTSPRNGQHFPDKPICVIRRAPKKQL